MATVDVSLTNSYFEDVKRFKIVKGEEGSLILNSPAEEDYKGPIDYASTGDPVLDLRQDAELPIVEFTAKEIGVSRFFFIQKHDTEFKIISQVRIEVVAAISDPAVTLDASGEAVDKVE